jgi:hypothetical protein
VHGLLNCVREAPRRAQAALADPVEAWFHLRAKFAERHEARPPCRYSTSADWERQLHEQLGVQRPCEVGSEFSVLWSDTIGALSAKGLRVGPETFSVYNDGDAALSRAVWCLVRHLRANTVVETGVARGITSRFVLEALERNGGGHLWSIDLPPPLRPELRAQVGAAVSDRLRQRWTYIEGSSRRRLPALLAKLGQIDLFVHDSRHSEDNVRFEMDQAWSALRVGGAIVVDDIDLNWGFLSFMQSHPRYPMFVGEAEPVTPDRRRYNSKGLFGIVINAEN